MALSFQKQTSLDRENAALYLCGYLQKLNPDDVSEMRAALLAATRQGVLTCHTVNFAPITDIDDNSRKRA